MPRLLVITILFSLLARAQEPPAAKFGFEQRVRNENWNNLFDYNGAADDEREQIRYRTRVWANLPAGSHFTFNVGLDSETNQKMGQHNRMDEIVFDMAHVEIRDVLKKGLWLKAGRQELFRGEGLIFAEGSGCDGSRTTYFNAIDLGYMFGKSTIEALGILNPKYDRMLPRIGDSHRVLLDRDQAAVGLYYSGKFDAYWFHNKETRDRFLPSQAQSHPDRHFETAGGRTVRKWSSRWSTASEAAFQWGSLHTGAPVRGFAAYTYAKRTFDRRWKPYAIAGYWAMSPGWDPLFARWTKFGDLELYSQNSEYGAGFANNIKRVQFEAGFSPRKDINWRFMYYHVTAFEPFRGSSQIFGSGLDRGDNFQTRMDFHLNSAMRGHVVFETVLPGDFYAHRGRAYFLRFEMIAEARGALSKRAK